MVHINIAQKDINSLNDNSAQNNLSKAIDKVLELLSEEGKIEALEKGFMLEESSNVIILKVPNATEQLEGEMKEVYKKVALLKS
jgi:hypothetical protein